MCPPKPQQLSRSGSATVWQPAFSARRVTASRTGPSCLAVLDRYHHALYIMNTSKEEPQSYTELNCQFLTTLSMTVDESRPRDLPGDWYRSPAEESRHWITKATE